MFVSRKFCLPSYAILGAQIINENIVNLETKAHPKLWPSWRQKLSRNCRSWRQNFFRFAIWVRLGRDFPMKILALPIWQLAQKFCHLEGRESNREYCQTAFVCPTYLACPVLHLWVLIWSKSKDLVGTVCNFQNFLPLRFYVKSILRILGVQKQ